MSLPGNTNANANVDQKVLQYENFINEVLKRDLQKVLEQRDSVYEKISQYLQLKNTIQSIQEAGSQKLKADVDLGCNFYVQAEVEDSSRIFVAIGYGFFVEMSHEEALRFIEKKTSQLTAFTEQLTKDSAKIKANIRMVLEGLRELQGLTDLPDTRGETFSRLFQVLVDLQDEQRTDQGGRLDTGGRIIGTAGGLKSPPSSSHDWVTL